MALIDKASLLMVPSTYEAGKLYNVLPSGNRAPDSTDQNSGYDNTRADFDFDRGSNAAATRIGSDGLIKKYRENKLLRSNQFDTTWVTNSASVTSGQADKDGGTSAWKLQKSGANGRIYQSVTSNGVHTFSVYAKAGDDNWAYLVIGSSAVAWFDLANGAIGTKSSEIDAKIESYGDSGFYRISLTFNHNNPQVRIYPADGNNDTSGTSGSIFIQNAQLETGLVATDYLDSGATTAKAGVLVDLPRINYDANGENGSLLLEPSRQQLFQYSEYFGAWALSNTTLVANDTKSPEGIINAYKLKENTANSTHFSWLQATTTSATHCFSIFAKAGERKRIALRDNQIGNSAVFDLESGSVVSGSGGSIIESANGFYRITLKGNYASAGTRHEIYILPDNATTALTSYQGNGSSGVYIYGAQLEAGSYPTSYIPNHGTSSGVTRSKDNVANLTNLQTNSLLGTNKGTLFIDFKDLFFEIAGTTLGSIMLRFSNTKLIEFVPNTNTTFRISLNDAVVTPVFSGENKIAISYDTNGLVIYRNGVSVYSTSSSTYSVAYTDLVLTESVRPNNTNINNIQLYNTRLTNAELATLTTL